MLAHEIRPRLDRLGGHIHHPVEIAIAQHAPARLFLAGCDAVDDGRFDAARREEQPFEIRPTAIVADGNVELGIWKLIGKIGADGGRFRHDHIAMLECRHLAHGVDGQIVGGAMLAFGQHQELNIIGLAEFL